METYGYGLWEVVCPQCKKARKVKAHKYKDGTIRGSENVCHGCRAINLTKEKVRITCPSCGDVRELKLSDSKNRITQYCKVCVRGGVTIRHRGGKRVNKTSRGYAMVMGMKGHPLANAVGQVHEHWMVMYDNLPAGHDVVLEFKRLGFTIHHKNGIRLDNSYDNLQFMAPGKHPIGWTIDEMREIVRRYDAS